VAAGLEFLILGALEVRADGRPLQLGAAKQRALLALLLLSANELVPASRLVDELWDERPPATAGHSVQVYVSQLRKLLRTDAAGADVIVSRPPGYLLRVAPEQFDLRRFERLVEEADGARAVGDAALAAGLLREALALWRGAALADLVHEPFAQTAAARLEEIRLAAVERRIEVDLLLGRHADLVGELEQLAAEHPLRERLHGQLMLALYRSGRQAEALDVYRRVRHTLSEELGLEPSPALQQLERSILQQDPELEQEPPVSEAPASTPSAIPRSILLLELEEGTLERLLAVAEPLARLPPRELILMALVEDAGRLPSAVARLHERRAELLARGLTARAAAFTSVTPGGDAARAVSEQEIDVLLVAGSDALLAEAGGSSELAVVLDRAPCHVGVLFGRTPTALGDGAVVVPFGGAEDDWAAVELAAWLARGRGAPLKLLGTAGDRTGAPRDASRLLASASLAVQRATGIPAEPCLVAGGMEPLLAAAHDASLIVVGLSQRWRREGIGPMRLALAKQAHAPTLFVRGSLRPSGLAPQASLTRYTWSLATGY
jgi:DNA-binding SARP family transcriptional activator